MKEESLRIALADDETDVREEIKSTLVSLGHQVVSLAENGEQLVQDCLAERPDLAITDIIMPDMDGLDAAARIYRNQPIPIIIVSAYHDPEFLERAGENHILAYLTKPVRKSDLEAAIAIAMQRSREFHALQKETDDLRQALEDRKVIERAKGILMKQANLDEPEAFRRLQKTARRHGAKLVDIARNVVSTAELLESD